MDTANNNGLSAGTGLNEGDIVECVVEQIMPYGAFVRISENGRKGMIHISELSYNFVKDINEAVKIQDKIKAKVIKIDDRGRIDLSLKQTMTPPPRTPAVKPKFANPVRNNTDGNENGEFRAVRDFHEMRAAYKAADPEAADSFEKKMASFLKTSEAKITDLNSRNSARSGRSSRRRGSRD